MVENVQFDYWLARALKVEGIVEQIERQEFYLQLVYDYKFCRSNL